MSAPEDARKLWDMIGSIQFAMLTTTDEDGTLRSRPMAAVNHDFDGELWFFTRASSHKTLEIDRHHQVNLAYSDPDEQNYVSVSGTATLVRDSAKAKELWKEPMRTWFPDGPDDPDLALLRVRADSAEYWDAPSSAMVHAYGYVKARLTGEPPKPGENRKLDLR
ncbi:pyridoxamine 5'-phosphate oxidase family protein [Arenibaculum sp.]|uniref:pyridoxamine 5'-phosphate oxidase family protein n=1 Tax=Arenibaculum sp. TaxID=2865862 RepID=UPI002E0FD4D9|nr:pyridoxamine 5'-phosphate oxidase family protein [Arenibaculum sp.]